MAILPGRNYYQENFVNFNNKIFECNKLLYCQEGTTIRKILLILIIRFLGKFEFKIFVVTTSTDQFSSEVRPSFG